MDKRGTDKRRTGQTWDRQTSDRTNVGQGQTYDRTNVGQDKRKTRTNVRQDIHKAKRGTFFKVEYNNKV